MRELGKERGCSSLPPECKSFSCRRFFAKLLLLRWSRESVPTERAVTCCLDLDSERHFPFIPLLFYFWRVVWPCHCVNVVVFLACFYDFNQKTFLNLDLSYWLPVYTFNNLFCKIWSFITFGFYPSLHNAVYPPILSSSLLFSIYFDVR